MSGWKRLMESLKLQDYISNFENERVTDESFLLLEDDDFDKLIPEVGPRKLLGKHLKLIKDGKVYSCCFCQLNFPIYDLLREHIKTHEVPFGASFKCKHCNQQLAHAASFLRHMREFFTLHRRL